MCRPVEPYLAFPLFLQLVVHFLYCSHILFALVFNFTQAPHGKRHFHPGKRNTRITQEMLQENQEREDTLFVRYSDHTASTRLQEHFKLTSLFYARHVSSLVVVRGWAGMAQCESTRLPPMWPRFDSRTRHHMWVEFFVGSCPCSGRFLSGWSGFPLSSKINLSKF